MRLPDRRYERLPCLYGIAGLVTFCHFDTGPGYLSGFLLLMTACLIWFMRRDYRRGRVGRKP